MLVAFVAHEIVLLLELLRTCRQVDFVLRSRRNHLREEHGGHISRTASLSPVLGLLVGTPDCERIESTNRSALTYVLPSRSLGFRFLRPWSREDYFVYATKCVCCKESSQLHLCVFR
jgi:hypothetical protein